MQGISEIKFKVDNFGANRQSAQQQLLHRYKSTTTTRVSLKQAVRKGAGGCIADTALERRVSTPDVYVPTRKAMHCFV